VDSSVTGSTRQYPIAGLDMPCDPTRPDYPIRY
jgi:hypothetical protein